jgi:hypothetical protein
MAKKVTTEAEVEVNASQEEMVTISMIKVTDAKEMNDETLKSEQIRYNDMANKFGELLKTKKYGVKLDDIKDAKTLLKHFEKNVKWTHAEAPLFVAAYQKLKDAITGGLNENGELPIDGPALNGIYQILLKTEGVGFFAVRDYMSLLTLTGEGISNAMRMMVEDQNTLKSIHVNLSVLDDETNARQMGIEVENLEEVKH